MIVLDLPWPPTVNHYYGRRKSGKKYIKQEGIHFRAAVWLIVHQARCTKMLGDLEIIIWMYPPDRRKRDTDNILKALFDAIEKSGIIDDDYQFSRHIVERFEPVKPGHVHIKITQR